MQLNDSLISTARRGTRPPRSSPPTTAGSRLHPTTYRCSAHLFMLTEDDAALILGRVEKLCAASTKSLGRWGSAHIAMLA